MSNGVDEPGKEISHINNLSEGQGNDGGVDDSLEGHAVAGNEEDGYGCTDSHLSAVPDPSCHGDLSYKSMSVYKVVILSNWIVTCLECSNGGSSLKTLAEMVSDWLLRGTEEAMDLLVRVAWELVDLVNIGNYEREAQKGIVACLTDGSKASKEREGAVHQSIEAVENILDSLFILTESLLNGSSWRNVKEFVYRSF